ncbi:hypothetical protein EK21DRAFT_87260 [Setomelanomma holmii]|uniref:Ankyrin n=1 Tax=Setomelanomma holmii TaxID=210430 RepID=A0A9P4LQ61_9PLEO|nr:hypothetical protein EK21DRAFT_87260 [Setomelanomma holmii]
MAKSKRRAIKPPILPNEIKCMIIEQYIPAAGILKAWRAREVDRLFAEEIRREILRKQPPEVLRKLKAGDVINELMHEILEHRMKARNGFSDVVPNMINRIIENISAAMSKPEHSEDTSKADEGQHMLAISVLGMSPEKLMRAVCEIVGRNSPHIWGLALMPREEVIFEFDDYSCKDEALVVAIGLDDRDSVETLLEQGSSLWGQTRLFGYTWTWMAKHCNADEVLFLTHLAAQEVLLPEKRRIGMARKRTLGSQIEHLIYAGKHSTTWVLLDFYLRHMSPPTKPVCQGIFLAAIQTGAIRILDRLLQDPIFARHSGEIRDHLFGLNSYPSNTGAMIETMISRGLFNNAAYGYNIPQPHEDVKTYRGSNPKTQFLLDIAVMKKAEDTVATLLNGGACANGIRLSSGHHSYPLRQALKVNSLKIAEELLSHGADPCMGVSSKHAERFVWSVCKKDEDKEEMKSFMLGKIKDKYYKLFAPSRLRDRE